MIELVIKTAVAACVCTVAALIIRRGSQEMALVLSLGACCVLLLAGYGLISGAAELMSTVSELTELSPAVLSPVLKCVGIGAVTRLAADMCRDGGQGAVAGVVEMIGALAAVCTAIPLAQTLIDMLRNLI